MTGHRGSWAAFACLVVFACWAGVGSSSAPPAPGPRAKPEESLRTLERSLPRFLARWMEEDQEAFYGPYKPAVRLCRLLGPDRAKLTIVLPYDSPEIGRLPEADVFLSVYLDHHSGRWTTTRFDAGRALNDVQRRAVHALMLAIDETGD